jgi:hypothetical protein
VHIGFETNWVEYDIAVAIATAKLDELSLGKITNTWCYDPKECRYTQRDANGEHNERRAWYTLMQE